MPRRKVRTQTQMGSAPVAEGGKGSRFKPNPFSELYTMLRNDYRLTQADLGEAFAVSAKTFAR